MQLVKFWTKIPILFFAFLFFASCTQIQIKKELKQIQSGEIEPAGIKITYPQNATIFPPEIAAPLFKWKNETSIPSKWDVFISSDNGNVLVSSKCDKNSWRPDSSDWEKIKAFPDLGDYTFVAVANKAVGGYYPSGMVRFSFSKDSVGADIFFRAVTLPFSYAVKNPHTIEWYLGDIKGNKPRKMLDNLPVCGNCHSFTREQPLLAMDVDYGYDKGSYTIAAINDTCSLNPENIITWSDYKKEENEPTYGLLSQISPDGNFVLSTVKDLSIFAAVDNNLAYSQLFFPIKGIIGIYNRKDNSFDALNGASDKKYVQSNPSWSPDGKKVVFAKTGAFVSETVANANGALLSIDDIKELSSGGIEFKFDLYTVDFNNGKGGIPVPLEGASNNGKSNYFAKFSPDGKWIVFCQADNYMLLQRDSRLYIMPSEGGEPRLMSCNMEEMNSWHSWSPNGRWLVFSSKNRSLYTQLYLTHIDENGMDSPPVLLENLCFKNRAVNIPEFYPFDSEHFMTIMDDFSQTPKYFNKIARTSITNKYYKRAMEALNKATEIDSNYLETYFNRIMLNAILQQANSKEDLADKKKAMEIVMDSLSQNPENETYLTFKITLLSNMGRNEEALKEASLAVQEHPANYSLYELLYSLYRKDNQYEKAIQCYKKMMKLNPRNKHYLNKLTALAYMKLNNNDDALKIINKLIEENPDDKGLFYSRAQIMLDRKNFDPAKKDIDYILKKDTTNYKYHELLAQYYLNQDNKRLYFFQRADNLKLLQYLYGKNNEDVDILFEMASHYMAVKDFQNAESQFDLILNYFPNNYEALKQKAKIKLTLQQWNEAISIYDRLETNYLPEEEFYNNKAIAFIQTGDYPKAMDNFNKTIELDPDNKDAIFNRNKLKSMMAGEK